jgi:hypothetical protein
MVGPEYTNYFVASTGASAALLGLLFVSVSIAPERIFGTAAQAGHQALALSSFTALANAFFISLSGLIPNVRFGLFVIIAGAIALSQSLSLLRTVRSWKSEGRLLRGITLFIAAVSIYGSELFIGVGLYANRNATGLVTVLVQLLLAVFAMGLVRAWELLGAPRGRGIASGAVEWAEGKLENKKSQTGPS